MQVYLHFETWHQFLFMLLSLIPGLCVLFVHVLDWSDLQAIKVIPNLPWLLGNQGWLAFILIVPCSTVFWGILAIIVHSGIGSAKETSRLIVVCYGLCALPLMSVLPIMFFYTFGSSSSKTTILLIIAACVTTAILGTSGWCLYRLVLEL